MAMTRWGVGNARTTNDLITREEWVKRERRAELRSILSEVAILIMFVATCSVAIWKLVQMATCETCSAGYDNRRADLGYKTCVTCGEKEARQRKHTVVPLHKSNYMVPANADELRGINNKGGFIR